MKKRNLKSLNLHKRVISNLLTEAVKGQRGPVHDTGGSGDTHPDYTCHPETCNGRPQER